MSRVFLSHRSTDIAIVKDVAAKLHAAGIEVWLDAWNIAPGDDFVAEINSALVSCDAAVIFFSHAVAEGPWIQKEISYLIKSATEKRMPVIPVMLDGDAEVPALLATADRVGIGEIQRLIDRLLGKSPAPPVAAPVPSATLRRFRILLRVRGEGDQRRLLLSAWRDAGPVVEDRQTGFPPAFVHAFQTFLHLRVAGARDSASREHAVQRAADLRHLGEQIGQALFPDEVDAALTEFLKDATANASPAEIVIEAEGELLSIPFEAARLRNGVAPAMHPLVRFSRRLTRDGQPKLEPKSVPPGPFKVLVAVGHPDETKTKNAVLDYEREVQAILDALGQAVELKGSQVRWLEVGSLAAIGEALREDSYHVLHVSGHGGAGTIELEDHQGEPVTVTAAQLATEILKGARDGRPAPLVFLAACQSGLDASETASLAQGLLEHGVRQVVAMQTAVSDTYATALAGLFYRELTRAHAPMPSHALAIARQHLEAEREKAMARAESSSGLTPEYATPALFQLGDPQPLWDRTLAQEPLRKRGEVRSAGAVPMLGPDELIGRRPQVREVMAELTRGKSCGVQIVAMGGTGKSSLAGRVMRLLAEDGWLVAAVTGRYTIAGLAKALREAGVDGIDERMPEQDALSAIGGSLRSARVLLVLDDFHEMLEGSSARFRSSIDEQILRILLKACGKGRLLLTSRYPVAVSKAQLRKVDLGPLSVAESRKLLLRLGALEKQSPGLARLMTAIGGHPRMLEFLDGILNQGEGRLRHVTERLEARAAELGIDLEQTGVSFEEALALTVKLGAQDILLDDLLAGLPEDSLRALRHIAAFPEAVPLAVVPGRPSRELARVLARSSLVHQPAGDQEMVWVHRWTAELILGKMAEAERREVLCAAGRVLADPEGGSFRPVDGMRLLFRGGSVEEGAKVATGIGGALEQLGQHAAMLAFVDEVLPWLTEEQFVYPAMFGSRAAARGAFGDGPGALEDYQQALKIREARARQEPGRADYQRDLQISHERMGDVCRQSSKVEEMIQHFATALAIAERLAANEPGRADLQISLVVPLTRLPTPENLTRALGILETLDSQGRLMAEHQAWIPMVREMVQRARETSASGS